MDKVCCIVDVNGFSVKVPNETGDRYSNQFFVRELGYVRVEPDNTHKPKSYRFDLRTKINFGRLSEQDRRTLRYQSEKLLGMMAFPHRRETDVLPYEDLQDIVKKIHEECRREGADAVAFKGGDQEKKLLEVGKIPYLDLHGCGCPAFDQLSKSGKLSYSLHGCGHHTEMRGNQKVKCSMMAAHAYRDWYMANYKQFSSKKSSCQSSGGTSSSSLPRPPSEWSSSDSDDY